MDETTASIDVILRAFVSELLDTADDERRRCLLDLDTTLRRYLESELENVLCSDCRTVLFMERQFDPDHAVCGLFDACMIVVALPGFVGSAWLPIDAGPRANWLQLVLELIDFLLDDDLIEWDEALDARDAVRVASQTPTKKLSAAPAQKSSETAKKDAAFQEWANDMFGDKSPYRGTRGRPSARPDVDPGDGSS
jgi:hypothetical protein